MEKDLSYYMELPYHFEVQYDKKEGGYALYCPDLPGCMTCAETVEAGFAALEDTKRCWFEACLRDGTAIPEPHTLEG